MALSDEVRQRLKAKGIGRKSREEIVHRMTAKPEPSPFDEITYTGDIAIDGPAELEALMAAFKARLEVDDPPFAPVTDSRHWVGVCFLTREDKEYFLLAAGLYEHGDKYLDGQFVLERLEHVRANGPAPVKTKEKVDRVAQWLKEKPDLTQQQIAFRLAADKVKDDMRILGDSEYWLAFCFRTAQEREAFLQEHPPVEGTKYLDGYLLAEGVGIEIPEEER